MGSWFVAGDANAELQGLNAFAKEDRPPVWITFWAFRVMVGMGLAMVGLGALGRGRLGAANASTRASSITAPSSSPRLPASSPSSPAGSPPKSAASPTSSTASCAQPTPSRPSPAGTVATSLLFFMIVYAIVFSAGALYILRLMAKGPDTDETARRRTPANRPARRSATGVTSAAEKGG